MFWWWWLAWIHIASIHDISINETSQNFLRHSTGEIHCIAQSLLCCSLLCCVIYIYGWVDKAGLFLSGDFWPLGLFCCVSDKDWGNTISVVRSTLRVLYFWYCYSLRLGLWIFGQGETPLKLWMNDSCFDQPMKYRLFWHNQSNKLNNTSTYLFLYFQFWFGLAQPQYLEMAPSKKGVSINVIIGVYSSADLELIVLYGKHLANFLIFMVENSHCGSCRYIKLSSIVLMIPKHRQTDFV